METETALIETDDQKYERLIRDAYERTGNSAGKAKEATMEAINAAVECGQRMIDAKAFFDKGFDAWLARVFPDLSRQYLNRYKQLAEAVNRGLQLEGHSSLRQAFIAAGILPEATRESAQKPSGVGSCVWLTSIQRTWDTVQKLKVEDMTEIDRESLKTRLKPYADKYAELSAQAAG